MTGARTDQGKPVARRGRKARGLDLCRGGPAAGRLSEVVCMRAHFWSGRSAAVVIASLVALLTVPVADASAAPKKVAFKFSATTYSVAENVGTFNVTVLRSGNT